MNEKMKTVFDEIKAEDTLKKSTLEYIKKELKKKEESKKEKIKFKYRWAMTTFAMLMVIFIGGYGYTSYAKAVTFVSVDINPSIELEINKYDKVVDVTSYNRDGNKIIKELDYRGKSYEVVIENLLKSKQLKALDEDKNPLSFTVVSDKDKEIIKNIEHCKGYKEYRASCSQTSNSTREEAEKLNMSFGKYRAYQDLKKIDPTIDVEKVKKMTMSQIHNLTENHGNNKNNNSGNGKNNNSNLNQGAGKDNNHTNDSKTHKNNRNGDKDGNKKGRGSQHNSGN